LIYWRVRATWLFSIYESAANRYGALASDPPRHHRFTRPSIVHDRTNHGEERGGMARGSRSDGQRISTICMLILRHAKRLGALLTTSAFPSIYLSSTLRLGILSDFQVTTTKYTDSANAVRLSSVSLLFRSPIDFVQHYCSLLSCARRYFSPSFSP